MGALSSATDWTSLLTQRIARLRSGHYLSNFLFCLLCSRNLGIPQGRLLGINKFTVKLHLVCICSAAINSSKRWFARPIERSWAFRVHSRPLVRFQQMRRIFRNPNMVPSLFERLRSSKTPHGDVLLVDKVDLSEQVNRIERSEIARIPIKKDLCVADRAAGDSFHY